MGQLSAISVHKIVQVARANNTDNICTAGEMGQLTAIPVHKIVQIARANNTDNIGAAVQIARANSTDNIGTAEETGQLLSYICTQDSTDSTG
jgi:hypothetical protein